jgi:deazaflavin-dependent oxidoreductase (nitroreductase family)
VSKYRAPQPATPLPEPVRRALSHPGLIDITTTGRRTGEPRRIEIVYHVFDGRIYISGMPRARRRSWLANLEANPRMTVHLKRGPVADLPGTARVITDPEERHAVMARIIASAWHDQDLQTMVAQSPLIEVTVEGLAA